MIKSKSKLIFILVPGMREYLRQHSSGDDTVRMVQRAAKVLLLADALKNYEHYFYRAEVQVFFGTFSLLGFTQYMLKR